MSRTMSAAPPRTRAGLARFVLREPVAETPAPQAVMRDSRRIRGAQDCTFEDVADWSPADLLSLGVQGSSSVANRERCRRAMAVIAECEPYPDEFDEPPVLRLLIRHRG